MSIRVITISREFGSGGRTIAKMVAERLGFDYYDRELVSKIAKESGMAEDFIIEQGEYATSRHSFLFDLSIGASAANGGRPLSDQLYVIQHNIIEDLAEKGNCVIVGRCADHILAERKDCLHVFCHADMDFRAKHVVENYGETEVKVEKRIKEKDDKRKVYYRHYTGKEFGKSQNYNLTLDTGKIGIEQCADIIAGIVKESMK